LRPHTGVLPVAVLARAQGGSVEGVDRKIKI
jgi:hypothetical protein